MFNALADGAVAYTYSDRGRMNSATIAGNKVSLLYNGLEQRVAKTGPTALVPSGASYYAYDEAGRLVGEYDANQAPLYETVYLGSMPVAVLKQAGTAASSTLSNVAYNVYSDHLDTPRVITRSADEAMVWRWDGAEAFGATAADQNPKGLGAFIFNQRFPGQILDAEVGNLYNWHRDYRSELGRYVQSDPIGLQGGVNTYIYVGGDPANFSDPQGLEPSGASAFIKAIFPDSQQMSVPMRPDIIPSTTDPCVLKYLDENYPPALAWMAKNGNIQQYIHENLVKGAEIGAEKLAITQGPGYAGRSMMRAVPGNQAVWHVAGKGLTKVGAALSGVAEFSGAVLTPFGTTAMAMARQECTCRQQ